MSDDDTKPKLPCDADTLVSAGTCEATGAEHIIALKDGVPVASTHMTRVTDGKPLPPGSNLYYVDRNSGRVVDAVRIGKGPAKVSSRAYRDGYDRIFGAKRSELN